MIRLLLSLIVLTPAPPADGSPLPTGLTPSAETVVVAGETWPTSLTGTLTHALRETYGGDDPATPWCQDGAETLTAAVRLDLDRSASTVRYVAGAGTWEVSGSCAGVHTWEARDARGQTVTCTWTVSVTYRGGGAFPSDGAHLEVRPDADGFPEVVFGVVGEATTENVVDCDATWSGGTGDAAWGDTGPRGYASAAGIFPLNLGSWERAGGELRAVLRGANAYGTGGPAPRFYEASWAGEFSGALPVASEGGGPGRGAALSVPAPNPTVGRATLTLVLDHPGPVTVTAHDALGRTVAVLWDGPAPGGPLPLAIEAGVLSPGRYVVRARGAGVDLTRPLTVVR
jgi:hypothetical protein